MLISQLKYTVTISRMMCSLEKVLRSLIGSYIRLTKKIFYEKYKGY